MTEVRVLCIPLEINDGGGTSRSYVVDVVGICLLGSLLR